MSIDKDIKVAVVGAGFIGPAHVEALRRLGIDVIGLWKGDAESSAQKANEMGLSKGYQSYEALLDDSEVDVVHITSPNYQHYEQAKAALQAGKHVVCEKPLAMNAKESQELVSLAKEKQRVNAVNFNLRFYPLVQEAHAMVTSGDLGEIYIVQGSYLQDWLLLPTDWNWRLEPDLGGEMRAVADIGSHWLDLTTFITGLKIEAVLADFKTFLPVRKKPTQQQETFGGKLDVSREFIERSINTEDYASILLRFSNGARGVLTVSQVSAGRKNRLYYEIDGANSALAWNSERPNELWVGHRERANELLLKDPALLSPGATRYVSYPGGHNEGFPDTFKQLYKSIYSYIETGDYEAEADFATFEGGHQELVIGEAIFKSSREGRWIDV